MSSTSDFNIIESKKIHHQKELLKSASVISCATMVSRVLGYIRDMLFAHIFGAEMIADAFFVAFKIPNLFRHLLGEGALSASFIPVFTEFLKKQGKKSSWELASNAISITGLLTILLTIFGILFAPYIVLIIAPGFYNSKSKFNLTVLLTRILFPYIIIISIVALTMGILNSLKHFAIPALSPAAFNIGIIFGILYLSPKLNRPIIGAALGVLIGGLIQFLIEYPVLRKKGAILKFNLAYNNPGTKRIGLLMVPAAIGLGVTQINLMVDTLLASFLPEGSISYLYYGNRLIQLPLAIFGISLGTALLPTLSSLATEGKTSELLSTFSFGMRTVLFISLPASIGLIVYRIPIISLLFQRGEFTYSATIATAQALFAYSVGLAAFSGLKVIVPVFYAYQDTSTPVRIGIMAMVLNICLNIILMFPLKHAGLALATSLSSFMNLLILVWIIRKRWGNIDEGYFLKNLAKIILNSLLMGLICYWFIDKWLWIYAIPGKIWIKAYYLFLGIMIGGITYLVLGYISGSEELQFIISHLPMKKGQKEIHGIRN